MIHWSDTLGTPDDLYIGTGSIVRHVTVNWNPSVPLNSASANVNS